VKYFTGQKTPDFVHLHNHTDYSLLDSVSTVEKLVEAAAALGMRSLAITDSGNLSGAMHFYQECKNAGIKPIIGCEVIFNSGTRSDNTNPDAEESHLVLLAQSRTGYINLMTLSSAGYTGCLKDVPKIKRELIEQNSTGLIALSACLRGEIPKLLLAGEAEAACRRAVWYRDVFGPDQFYLELQDHGLADQKIVNTGLIEISKKTGVPVVCTNNTHYVRKEDVRAHDILHCIAEGKTIGEIETFVLGSDQFYLKSAAEMYRLFSEVPEACKNTVEIAEKCRVDLTDKDIHLPKFPVPESYVNGDMYLKQLTRDGLELRYGDVTDEVRSRGDRELESIISAGFTDYFLIVWDYVRYAREKYIPVGPGRGSSGSSIVAYALGITNIDPLEFGLIFERFFNLEIGTLPDFDIDFCFDRRNEVIEYVRKTYGPDSVAFVIKFRPYRPATILHDCARAYGISEMETHTITDMIPGGYRVTIEEALLQQPKLRELKEKGGKYFYFLDAAEKLQGIKRLMSVHAAGIVIGKSPLSDLVPLRCDPESGSAITQFSAEWLQKCGLVRFDFLGMTALTVIKNILQLLKRRGIEIDTDTIRGDDEKTFEMLDRGESNGVLFFQSLGMQDLLRRFRPDAFKDLMALHALYRPGSIENIPEYFEAKQGRTPIYYPHPAIVHILKETYGIIIYQEQIIRILCDIGGFSPGRADMLRRLLGKKKRNDIAELKLEFLQGTDNRGIDREAAEEIFRLIEKHAVYSFSKSHTAAYTLIGYHTAYLKAHYPKEFEEAQKM
jgi:DNA polymerase III subunit alpha